MLTTLFLHSTRWFKKHTRFVRYLPDKILSFGEWASWRLSGGRTRKGRRSLVWRVDVEKHVSLNVLQA